jgi:uncharacterized protein (TIGR02444 family)
MTSASEKPREESPFWRFSLRFYSRPSVAGACLALQDEAGADINLMLFLLFLAEHKRQVTRDDIARLDGTVRSWRDSVVKPLRALRRVLKIGIGEIPIAVSETFRGQIKRLELESEQIEQHVLEGCVPATIGVSAPLRDRTAEANLAAYSDYLGGLPAQALATILAAFGEFGRHHPAGAG